jgi:hypothetical protein
MTDSTISVKGYTRKAPHRARAAVKVAPVPPALPYFEGTYTSRYMLSKKPYPYTVCQVCVQTIVPNRLIAPPGPIIEALTHSLSWVHLRCKGAVEEMRDPVRRNFRIVERD